MFSEIVAVTIAVCLANVICSFVEFIWGEIKWRLHKV